MYFYDIGGFDWDRGNREKCQKHGVSIVAVERAFQTARAVRPGRTAATEERFALVSIDERNRGMFIVFTIRTRDGTRLIRPISARYMHEREKQAYERTKAT